MLFWPFLHVCNVNDSWLSICDSAHLGGNSLLDCVVFGRVAGKAACKYIFGADGKFQLCPPPTELKALTS